MASELPLRAETRRRRRRRGRACSDGLLDRGDAAHRREGRADFRALLPQGTRVYIAHIDGTPIEEMVATAAAAHRRRLRRRCRISRHGSFRTGRRSTDWLARYPRRGRRDPGAAAGGRRGRAGRRLRQVDAADGDRPFRPGFTRLHVAGHPEGNRDIDPDGGTAHVAAALRWKQDFAERTDAKMAIATQFCFEAQPVIAWADRAARAEGSACRSISASRAPPSCRR